MSRLGQTPSATVGPYFSMKLEEIAAMAPADCSGEHVRIEGRVFDGDGEGVGDALIEIWQANAAGRYRHPADARDALLLEGDFTGYGRVHTEFPSGDYTFTTVKPGPVPASVSGEQAPHLNLIITARGVLHHLFTRLYFEDETANATDPVLHGVAPERQTTLVAEKLSDGAPPTYRFNIRLQGDGETVFFDV